MADWLTDDDAHHFGNCIRVLIFCGLLKGKFDYTQIEQKEDVVYTSNALIKLKKPDFICSWAQTFRIYGTSPHQIAIDFEHVYGIMTALPPSSPFPPPQRRYNDFIEQKTLRDLICIRRTHIFPCRLLWMRFAIKQK